MAGCQGLIGEPAGRSDGSVEPPTGDASAPTDAARPRIACDQRQSARAPMRRLTPEQYRNAVRDVFEGRAMAGTSFPAQARSESAQASGFSTDPERNVVSEASAEQIMIAAEETAESVAGQLATLLPCSAMAGAGEACVNTFVDRFVRRALRRAPTMAERDRLLGLYRAMRTSGGDFGDGIAVITAAVLQMPDFLYLPEGGTLADNVRALGDYELASRLSFLFWDSVPDDALLDAAARGELRTSAQREAQARRLIASDRARPAIMRFFREWIHIRALGAGDRADPAFDQRLATAIQEGFERYVLSAVRDGRTLTQALTSTDVFVNARLAEFYGLPANTAANDTTWVRATLDPTVYAGLVTQPAVMAGLAHDRDPSYVFRGTFVLQQLACQPLGSPPGNAQAVFDSLPLPPTASATDRSLAVRRRSDCNYCHDRIDPIGLAFDRFDEIGRLRRADRHGNAVASAGTSMLTGSLSLSFATPTELVRRVVDTGLCEPCLSKQWLRFTFGRREEDEDACTLQALTDHLDGTRGGDRSLLSMMVAMATSDAFANRRARETP